MSSPQPDRSGQGPHKLHRPFIFFDPEAVAVVAILLGVIPVLLAVPLYFLDIGLPKLYLLPLCVGLMFVTAGSFAVACEKSPSREKLKGCAYTNLAGLVGALCALCVYSWCIHSPPALESCTEDVNFYDYGYSSRSWHCPAQAMSTFFGNISTLLLIYDIAALFLHCLLSFSALKGLRII
ncbi:hypothetical protein AGOR_G00194540 [Albula goreensis]|uniref:Uncharacterized protein n=1 Tax=Albula goreensis TaxID=1534307 RepID=A0A8T3CU03_9TELE|nr:hypothetical protein AGOR_G00194540 [Albula goreensis]